MGEPNARTLAPKLLVDLVLDPRDPGYEAAARRNGGTPARHWYDRPVVALGCLAVGFTLALSYEHTHRSAPEAAKVQAALIDRVHDAEKRGDELATSEQQLNDRLNAQRAAALPVSSGLARQIALDELLAGAVAVSGPGFSVTLTEPPQASTISPVIGQSIDQTSILTDRDVQSVVNELWADGAEAIAVNGIRLTATSAIRFAGDAVLVDYQPISSPYVVDAIGDSDLLATRFASSDVASRYQTLASAKGIGFSFAEHSTLHLSATPAVTPRYARPLTTSTSGATK